ncbi:MAG TPA: four helix bundle protein [Lacunisphaera sp.]|jgi:four helix bundle protein|nr:four helix bundle protein [Lacunisphaera sp.]
MNSTAAKSFRDLIVWQKAHAFVLVAYAVTESFPATERYGITSQLRRAAVSIAANIVEGFRKRGQADKLRYFNIAQGSADECLYYLVLVHDLKFTDTAQLQLQLEEVMRLLQSYMNAIEK